jgi:UDP-N-acetylglucosamine 4,6-dehydratase
MDAKTAETFRDKTILVTGGTGSIGSEIVRQLLDTKAEVVRIFSRDETKQLDLLRRLMGRPRSVHAGRIRFLIGDVRDRYRLKRAMEGVEVVFHAAALKHVPACEYNPFEAVQTNVLGTQHVIEAALDAGTVETVVGISTDKASAPTNTMGATKLLAERLMTATSMWAKEVRLGCVRFGNVINSRGSVVPLMKEQIEKERAVTITDRRMTRFMMLIPDAAGLVLKAAAMLREGSECTGGEVFILKMPALRIEDLAKVMIGRLGGDKGKIESIGIRPGERLHERLLTEEETCWTDELKDMLIVKPEFRRQGLEKAPIHPSKYISNRGKLLRQMEIEELLEEAGVFKKE